jgi:quercetin dioxygenase-like cupin family protein
MDCSCNKKNKIEKGTGHKLNELTEYATGAVVSRTIVQNPSGTLTVFAFDDDQNLSEHSAPYDAIIQILDGQAEIIIGGNSNILSAGEMIIMPANIPHAVKAISKFKMLLTMLKA